MSFTTPLPVLPHETATLRPTSIDFTPTKITPTFRLFWTEAVDRDCRQLSATLSWGTVSRATKNKPPAICSQSEWTASYCVGCAKGFIAELIWPPWATAIIYFVRTVSENTLNTKLVSWRMCYALNRAVLNCWILKEKFIRNYQLTSDKNSGEIFYGSKPLATQTWDCVLLITARAFSTLLNLISNAPNASKGSAGNANYYNIKVPATPIFRTPTATTNVALNVIFSSIKLKAATTWPAAVVMSFATNAYPVGRSLTMNARDLYINNLVVWTESGEDARNAVNSSVSVWKKLLKYALFF